MNSAPDPMHLVGVGEVLTMSLIIQIPLQLRYFKSMGKRHLFLAVAALLLTLPAGCRREGPAERAGEGIDDAVDNVREGESPFKKRGPAEKAGEALDDAAKDAREAVETPASR